MSQGFEAAPPPHPNPPIQSKASKMKQIYTNSDYLCPVYARYEREKTELYGGWIIVTVVAISAAATLITIRFDFI